ncbi:MAG: phosphatidylserine/phosphatidylglycerophosphate/cardiolipin synthase family protein [Parachlamydiaceae bacterium]|nr:phosphatidylserine/phosphatidylglycerophosphate/cardiolipin synthase family protein [Parachlamydiaceae bacterium]
MKKKSRFKTRTLASRKLFLSTSFFLVLLFYAWIADAVYEVHLPSVENPVGLYSTEMQDDLTLTISKAINQAEKSVTLVIFNLTDGKIISSLREKSCSDCEVKVICDFRNSSKLEAKLGPKVKILKRDIKGLMHIKMLIIDNKQTWIGSANMTRESLRHYGNLMTAIDSEPFAEMASSKARSLSCNGETFLPITHRIFSLGPQNIELWFLPDDAFAVARLKKLIQGAKKSIRIAMFTWTRHDLAQEVINANNRGIKVEVAIDKKSADGCGKLVVDMLLKGKINLRLSAGAPLLHHKGMVIDGTTLVNGSANWTKAAFTSNDDCFIVVYPLLETQRCYLNKMWNRIIADSTPAKRISD